MEVLEFMNAHDNWEELLTQHPYNILVKRDEDYILLKYNQLSSDFSLPIVRECRGSIFYQNENGKYECVCRAFDKFGNYGESYVPKIDWYSAVVEEKVDGSLIKVWNHNNKWHVSTNGTIDAYKAEVDDNTDWTFGKLFNVALKTKFPMDFFNGLDKHMTYMFELVSPRSRCTIFYPETRLYYLGCRDMQTMNECKVYYSVMREVDMLYPKLYHLYDLGECQKYVNAMTKDEEGFVIRDKNYNRMKLKSPKYLMAFHLNNNGDITTKRILNMMKNEMIDDFMAYCPQHKDKVDEVISGIKNVVCKLESTWKLCEQTAKEDSKTFACAIRILPYNDFLFEKYKHRDLKAIDFLMNKPIKYIKCMIERCK